MVEGAEILHVDPDELVWASEIAERTGRSRQSIDQLVRGQRGPRSFPADPERSAVLDALNGALEARHNLRSSKQRAPLRRAVRQLLALMMPQRALTRRRATTGRGALSALVTTR